MNQPEIDNAIDAVAQELTAGEPARELKHAVLQRIENPRAVRHPSFTLARTALGVAAAIVAIALVRPALRPRVDPTPSGAPAVAPATAFAPQGIGQMALEARPKADVAPRRSDGSARRIPIDGRQVLPVRPASRTSIRATNWTEISAVAGMAPPPLEVAAMDLTDLSPPTSIRVDALAPIAPMTLASLDEPEGEQP